MRDRAEEFTCACEEAVRAGDRDRLADLVVRAHSEGIRPGDMRECLLKCLERARGELMTSRLCLPGFLLALDVVNHGMEKMAGLREPVREERGIPLVIGVVRGDPHDLGKNIIAAVYRAYGYRVVDLGRNVEQERFLEAVKTHEARILALSAMMSTTTPLMAEIIAAVRSRGGRIAVMAGGAFIDAAMAARFGADGYAESAVTVIEKTKEAYERVFGEKR